jgi:hypothetical protein
MEPFMMTSLQYLWYVLRHKWHVFVAGRALGLPFWQLITHDLSKFSPAEWGPYARIFPYFGRFGEAPREWVAAFDQAWEHHWTHNPHHPEYWAGGDDAPMISGMPDKYVREMVADWYGAGMAQGKPDIVGWYRQNTRRQESLHSATKERVERYLIALRNAGLIRSEFA